LEILLYQDEDGSTVKLNGTSQVDDDNLMIDYKLTTDDDQEVRLSPSCDSVFVKVASDLR
jgi:hypothetical protein